MPYRVMEFGLYKFGNFVVRVFETLTGSHVEDFYWLLGRSGLT